MWLSKMLFFLCSRPTIKFQGGSPVDPLFEPPADPPFWLDLSKIIFIVISASLNFVGDFWRFLPSAKIVKDVKNFRSLGTTTISGKTFSEWKGHSWSSRRVPGYSRSSSRNSKFHSRNVNPILGMASHDLSNAKTTILGSTLGAIPGIEGNPHEIFSFGDAFSERFLRMRVVPCARFPHELVGKGPKILTD